MTITIKTNGKKYPLLSFYDLPKKQKDWFDWANDSELFFKYKNHYYALSEFMKCEHEQFKNWNGYKSESFFSGVLFKFTDDTDYIIVASYYC